VGKAIANEIVSAHFANQCEFKNVVTNWVKFSTTGALLFGWWGRLEWESYFSFYVIFKFPICEAIDREAMA
jgi:hypothetical protein